MTASQRFLGALLQRYLLLLHQLAALLFHLWELKQSVAGNSKSLKLGA